MNNLASRTGIAGAFLLALAFALFLHGAIPFLATPTLAQALWSTGFSQSFANHSLLPYAYNFGEPEPAPISFGLAGAYPAALLIALGLHPSDAYAAMVAFWLSIAFFSAWRLGVKLGGGDYIPILAALAWITMPVIWVHSGYSMLSTGIALLPFYFLAFWKLFLESISHSRRYPVAIFYIMACIISVFMDGYSFIMFAVGSSILGAYYFIFKGIIRNHLLRFAFPVHVFSFALSYVLYAAYIGKAEFGGAPLDFFRGWGADVTFFLLPTQGVHWIWDLLGMSVPRSNRELFGDSSVWTTTYMAPLLIAGLIGWVATFSKHKISNAILIIALFGLYMSLGPSLKINSLTPDKIIQDGTIMQLMPAELAIAPTGSAWLSEYLPGFKNMRAAYRWVALAMFGLWFLLLLWLSRAETVSGRLAASIFCVVVIISNLPVPQKYLHSHPSYRDQFLAIDSMLRDDMRKVLSPDELVAFLPYRNDFLVNYIASAVPVRTYNIGGDKNLVMARESWPATMREFEMGRIGPAFADKVVWLLAQEDADAVVLPYIDLLWAAHAWPAPKEYEEQLKPIIAYLDSTDLVDIVRRDYYSVVRLKAAAKENGEEFKAKVAQVLCLPGSCLRHAGFTEASFTQVGRLAAGTLKSDGRPGFLIFGPYAPMNSGTYKLVVRGSASNPEGAWADVVSGRGGSVHARFPLREASGDGEDILLEEDVILSEAVENLEVRVFVGVDSNVSISGYELRRVEAAHSVK